MGADDWLKCPQCQDEKKKLKRKMDEAYGKVSKEEYEELQEDYISHVQQQQDEFANNSVRVDYEYGFDEIGDFKVNFSCTCQKCASRWSFQHTQKNLKEQERGE